ncbi:MAG: SIS domain-containing protein [Clostridiales bacterium]|jgi:D-sedoheptulose 7-phosphate isomerase|nr:SIS domain-containing protein [Clostridiales bacterium]
MKDSIKNKIAEKLFTDYPSLLPLASDINDAYELIEDCYKNGGIVMTCGNGGSAADSEHIVGELMKGFNLRRELSEDEKARFCNIDGGREIAHGLQRALPAISLVSQTSLISAFANDCSPDLVFAQQVFAYARSPFDVLIAMSTSGNSKNIVNAAKTAGAAGIKCIGITGEGGGILKDYCDVCIKLPKNTPYEVQELTLPLYHALCAMAEIEFFY